MVFDSDVTFAAAADVSCAICFLTYAVTKESKYRGDIFMVFDYAEHDLTGMMDAVKTRGQLTAPQVGTRCSASSGRIVLSLHSFAVLFATVRASHVKMTCLCH